MRRLGGAVAPAPPDRSGVHLSELRVQQLGDDPQPELGSGPQRPVRIRPLQSLRPASGRHPAIGRDPAEKLRETLGVFAGEDLEELVVVAIVPIGREDNRIGQNVRLHVEIN